MNTLNEHDEHKWRAVPEESTVGRPYKLFVCDCKTLKYELPNHDAGLAHGKVVIVPPPFRVSSGTE